MDMYSEATLSQGPLYSSTPSLNTSTFLRHTTRSSTPPLFSTILRTSKSNRFSTFSLSSTSPLSSIESKSNRFSTISLSSTPLHLSALSQSFPPPRLSYSPYKNASSSSIHLLSSSSELPIKVHRMFHNQFFALRFKIQIREQPVELNYASENPELHCESLTTCINFRSLLIELHDLLKCFGVAGIVRCFSDPLPVIEVLLHHPADVKNLLLNKDNISSHLWIMVCNAFIKMSKEQDVGLFKDEANKDTDVTRFQLTYRPGNSCTFDLFLVSPNSHRREVDFYLVTLANHKFITKLMLSSLVFDFPSAMSSYLHQIAAYQQPTRENVAIDDLRAELQELSNWFHLGMALEMKTSNLMSILFNYRYISACRSQCLTIWHRQYTNAYGDNQLTWSNVVKYLIVIGRKSIADVIVKKYGIPNYQELIKNSEKSSTKQIGLLNSPEIKSLIDELKERDSQLAEKIKPLRVYVQQKRVLEVSVAHLFQELKQCIDEVRENGEKREEMKIKQDKMKVEIEALQAVIRLYDQAFQHDKDEQKRLEEESEVYQHQTDTTTHENILLQAAQGQEEKQVIFDIIDEKISTSQSLQEDIEGISKKIKALREELTSKRNVLIKEHQLLLSKCQQVHQVQGAAGLLQAKMMQYALKIDHILQQKVAANTMFCSSVFKLLVDTLTEEIKGKEAQLTICTAREKRAQKMATETQDKLQDEDMQELTDELVMKGAEGDVDEDQRLLDWLKPVEKSMELRDKLLEAKMSYWSNERARRITSAEGKALKQLLDSLKETPVETEGQMLATDEDIDSEQTPTVEYTLKRNEPLVVKVNSFFRLTLPVDDTVKLSKKKVTYIAEIKALADGSVTTVPVTVDTSVLTQTMSMNFHPSVRGRYHLQIKSNNKPVKGIGIYTFHAKQSPTLLGYPVRVFDGLNYPYAVKTVPNSTLLIASESKGRKVIFLNKITGKMVITIGGPRSGPPMKIPNGIAIDKNGVIYVVDSGSHCIFLFSPEGTPIRSIGIKGDEYAQFCFPYGIQISPHDNTINICDHNNDRVQVFTSEMKFHRVVYAVSSYDVDFDSKGCMYTTDRRNHLIAVFNDKDQCINSIAGRGSEKGLLMEPRGIVIDEQDYIYVVEEGNCRVSVFDTIGQFITCFGQEGIESGEFSAPQGITVDEDGYIYVCDMLNNRIQVF